MMYAVKIPFDGVMLYVTEGDAKFNYRAKPFHSYQEAQDHAILWGEGAVVVKYPSDQNSHHKD